MIPLWADVTHHIRISSATTTKNYLNMLDFSCTLSVRNGVLWWNVSHPLLLTYIKTCLGIYMQRKMSTKSTISLFDVILGHNHQISVPKSHQNTRFLRFLSQLSAWQMREWVARTAIRCFRSVLNLFLCPCVRYETLLILR